MGLVGCATTEDLQSLQREVKDLRLELLALSRTTEGMRAFAEERLGKVEGEFRDRFSKEEVEQKARLEKLRSELKEETRNFLSSQANIGARIDELSSETRIVQGKLEENNHLISELGERLDQSDQKVATLTSRFEALERDLKALEGDLKALKEAVAKPASTETAPAAEPEAKAEKPPEKGLPQTPSPEEIYQTAYGDYTKGNYDLAISGFSTYLSHFPKASKAPNARYWLGESYYGQGNYLQAIKEFQALVRDHPKSDKAPGALLKQGYAYLELGEKTRARSVLQDLVAKYPRSQEATKAKERLNKLTR